MAVMFALLADDITGALPMDAHDQIVLGVIALAGTLAGALVYIIRNGRLIRNVNDAVNHVGPGDERLYDIISKVQAKQEEFDKKWGNLPEDMDDAVGLTELLHSMDRKIDRVADALADHVEWEQGMNVKYAVQSWPQETSTEG